jgi:EpsG family
MFLAVPLYLLGLAMAALPDDLREKRDLVMLQAAWIGICLAIMAAFVLVMPDYQLPGIGLDRLAYEEAYAGAAQGDSPEFEIGFVIITEVFAALTSSSDIYFLVLFLVTVALLHVLIAQLFQAKDWLIVYFFYFNYFVFFNGVLNLIRQSLAIGVACVAIACFLKDRWRMSCLLIVLATMLHSAAIFTFAIFLTRLTFLTVWRLVAIIFAVFALSLAGVTEVIFDTLVAVSGIYPKHLVEYSLGLWAWREYTGGVFRMDFLLFALLPLAPYLYISLKGHGAADKPQFTAFENFLRIYLTLLIPFSFFSYMMFSDRYILQAWFLLPIMICWPLLYVERTAGPIGSAVRVALLLAVAVFPNVIDYGTTLLRVCQELL